ncbi:MAG: hypothetical protein J6Y03_01075 [Alphaproteobacteria bacterium]|nr:hypothetical protein [Alphaproteobacteria bacterium]
MVATNDASQENLDLMAVVSEARVKRAQIFSWVFMSLAILSLAFNVLLVVTMLQKGGELAVMTQLFNITRGTNSLVLSDVLNDNLGNLELLQKAFVHRYIEERNFVIPDKLEMWRRWGPRSTLSLMSGRGVWAPVYRDNDERLKDLDDAFPMHADNIRIISHVGNSWLVEFDLWTHGKNGMTKQKMKFTLDVGFYRSRKQTVAIPGYYYNPLGMVVTRYHYEPSMEF